MLEIKNKEWVLVLHKHPDVDAITGAWLLQKFGEKKYQDISKARFLFWSGGMGPIPEGKKFIPIDIGGKFARFDHHPPQKFPEECATTLIAKDLGVESDPALSQIIKLVKASDLHGQKTPLDLTDTLRSLNLKYSDNPEKVLETAFEILDAKYEEQKLFFEAREELEKAKVTEIQRRGKILRIVTVKSENPMISPIARHRKLGVDAAIVIQQNSSGRVVIFTNNRYDLREDFINIVGMIRLEEQLRQGKKPLITSFGILSRPGEISQVPEWYFQEEEHRGGGKLLNGSLTAPDVPPTRIPLERIEEIVKMVFELDRNFWTLDTYSKFPLLKEEKPKT
ncbi:chromate resistance protein [Patescibacteria group bacterium]|nr:chromate resistance protein [Patescibacteria group bacterium]